jgi:hypothetical protein
MLHLCTTSSTILSGQLSPALLTNYNPLMIVVVYYNPLFFDFLARWTLPCFPAHLTRLLARNAKLPTATGTSYRPHGSGIPHRTDLICSSCLSFRCQCILANSTSFLGPIMRGPTSALLRLLPFSVLGLPMRKLQPARRL